MTQKCMFTYGAWDGSVTKVACMRWHGINALYECTSLETHVMACSVVVASLKLALPNLDGWSKVG